MPTNKVIYGNQTLIDITDTTAQAENVQEGKQFYDASGEKVTGTLHINEVDVGLVSDELWTLPNNYPDIDKIDVTDFYGAYLIYDLNKTTSDRWFISLEGKSIDSSDYTIERGHLENNIFIADFSQTISSGQVFRQQLDSNNGIIQLWRAYGTSQFRSLWFKSPHATQNTGIAAQWQPCVQRKVRFTNAQMGASYNTNEATATNAYSWTTIYLERENAYLDGTNIKTDLLYQNAYELKSIDIDGFKKYTITNLANTFENCYLLQFIDLFNLNLASVTNMSATFKNCYSLKTINLTTAQLNSVTNMSATFKNCYSLKTINLTGAQLNSVTTMQETFWNCYSLKTINFPNIRLNLITSIKSTFLNCFSLIKLDLSNTNLNNIAQNSRNQTFQLCRSLQILLLPDLNFWPGGFSDCISLEELSLNNYTESGTGTLTFPFPKLKTINILSISPRPLDFSQCVSLTHEGLLNILESVPTLEEGTTRTLTLSDPSKLKLTTAELAIATEKGWTIA